MEKVSRSVIPSTPVAGSSRRGKSKRHQKSQGHAASKDLNSGMRCSFCGQILSGRMRALSDHHENECLRYPQLLRPANLEKSNVSTDLDVPGYTHSATEKKVENVESGDEMEYEDEEDETPRLGKSKLHQKFARRAASEKPNPGFKCFYCNQFFSPLDQLYDHQIKECLHYPLLRGGKSKDDEKSESRAAVPVASKNTNIKCSHCHETFSGLRNLYGHFSRCLPREVKELDLNETNAPQPQRFHNCLICNKAYARYEDFARHEKSTHHAEQMKAGVSKRANSRLKRNFHSIELSDGSVEYPCNICGTRFKTYKKEQCHQRRCYERKYLNKTGIETSEDEDEDEDEDENSIPDWLQSGCYADDARENAEDALELFNELDGGKKYELVEAGPYSLTMISRGPIYHLNFQGKAKDCPNAKVETFFAQTRKHPSLVLDFCVSLGPSDELPRWKDANNRGCYYCRWSTIHHPAEKHEKLITGCRPREGVWLYGA